MTDKTKLRERDVELLKAWAGNNMNRRRTSEALFMAKSTLDYQIKRIWQRTGLDPRKFTDLVKLMMRIREEEERAKADTTGG